MTDYTTLTNAELNAAVAEKVMGWKNIECRNGSNLFS